MDPEKTLTFCLGLKAEEMTMSLQGLDSTEAATVSVSQKDTGMGTVNTVVNYQGDSGSQPVVSPQYCPGVNNYPGYLCDSGHCCGETGCCTYYYELWWFWLLWTVLILFSCFCAYRHRRAKLRTQQQQRQREINLIAYNGACNYPPSTLDLSSLAPFKLPSYEEVAAQPTTPPPPYSSVFALRGGAIGGPGSSYPCPPYLGPSRLTSSQSSDNYTSCSCESCSLTSPSSASFSMQVTDETYDSSRVSTPSEVFFPGPLRAPPPDLIPPAPAAPDIIPRRGRSSRRGGEGLPPPFPPLDPPRPTPRLSLSPLLLSPPGPPHALRALLRPGPLGVTAVRREETGRPPPSKHALFPSSNVDFFQRRGPGAERRRKEEEEEQDEEDEEDEEEDHFRHRRLTGDSGIEVCRCRVRREEGEPERGSSEGEGEPVLHDSADCSARTPLPVDCASSKTTEVVVVVVVVENP